MPAVDFFGMLFDFTFEDFDRVLGGDRTEAISGARDPTYSTSPSDDELELDEDDELFFSLMGGTICFFLVILLGF